MVICLHFVFLVHSFIPKRSIYSSRLGTNINWNNELLVWCWTGLIISILNLCFIQNMMVKFDYSNITDLVTKLTIIKLISKLTNNKNYRLLFKSTLSCYEIAYLSILLCFIRRSVYHSMPLSSKNLFAVLYHQEYVPHRAITIRSVPAQESDLRSSLLLNSRPERNFRSTGSNVEQPCSWVSTLKGADIFEKTFCNLIRIPWK